MDSKRTLGNSKRRKCGEVAKWHTGCLRLGIVGLASTKTVEIVAPKSSLTPCILDDDPAQLEMLSAVIAEMGYEAIPTSDPEEALKLVKSGQCRLVLVDVHMPGMDGSELELAAGTFRHKFCDLVLPRV